MCVVGFGACDGEANDGGRGEGMCNTVGSVVGGNCKVGGRSICEGDGRMGCGVSGERGGCEGGREVGALGWLEEQREAKDCWSWSTFGTRAIC